MLNSHPECFCGFEIFSGASIAENYIPWYLDEIPADQDLLQLRQSDECAFIERLFSLTAGKGYRVVGMKLMYNEGDDHPLVVDYLSAHPELRVVHVRRKNLLRRLVSMHRAQSTGIWWVPPAEDAAPSKLPAVRLSLLECSGDFEYVERKQAEYDNRFSGRPQCTVFYEDLLADPHATAMKVCEFLGLPEHELTIGAQKTGVDSLRDAIENYDELKQHVYKWASFFEE